MILCVLKLDHGAIFFDLNVIHIYVRASERPSGSERLPASPALFFTFRPALHPNPKANGPAIYYEDKRQQARIVALGLEIGNDRTG